MRALQLALLFFLTMLSPLFAEKIHVIFTSALISKEFDQRKKEYLASLQQFRKFGLEPWIIEATNIDASFFDKISSQVLYPNEHDDSFSNKGVNENRSILACIPCLAFNDEDIIIKFSGRYFLKDSHLLSTIEQTLSDYDVWGIHGKNFVSSDHLFTGCFAMRWKYYKQCLQEIAQAYQIDPDIPVEDLTARFIRKHHLRMCEMDALHIHARIFFVGGKSVRTYEW